GVQTCALPISAQAQRPVHSAGTAAGAGPHRRGRTRPLIPFTAGLSTRAFPHNDKKELDTPFCRRAQFLLQAGLAAAVKDDSPPCCETARIISFPIHSNVGMVVPPYCCCRKRLLCDNGTKSERP